MCIIVRRFHASPPRTSQSAVIGLLYALQFLIHCAFVPVKFSCTSLHGPAGVNTKLVVQEIFKRRILHQTSFSLQFNGVIEIYAQILTLIPIWEYKHKISNKSARITDTPK